MDEVILNDAQSLEIKRLQELHKLFWTEKLGYYPDKIEKVARKVTWEESNKEKEKLNSEFEEFLKEYNQ